MSWEPPTTAEGWDAFYAACPEGWTMTEWIIGDGPRDWSAPSSPAYTPSSPGWSPSWSEVSSEARAAEALLMLSRSCPVPA